MSSGDESGSAKPASGSQPKGDLAERANRREEIPRDGRAARALRTRQAVADALLDLIAEGDLRPTSRSIAERAGVSERTIFQHFEDLETLFSAAAECIGNRLVRRARYVAAEGPFEDRLESYVSELAYLHEAMTPVRRASRLHAPFSPAIADLLEWWRGLLRKGIERVFGSELERWQGDERRDVVESLALIVAWSSWENMRQYSGFSLRRARRVVKQSFRALLCEPPAPRAEMDGFADDDRVSSDRPAGLQDTAQASEPE